MPQKDEPERPPSELLRDALDAAGISARELARLLIPGDPTKEQVESKRRLVQKWLAGEHLPSEESAKAVAALVDVDLRVSVQTERRRVLGGQLAELVDRFERIAERLEVVLGSSRDGRPEPPVEPERAAGQSS